jgi:hypothetical protein
MRALEKIPWRFLAYHFLTGLILVVPALINKVPLVFSDTGTYLESARTLLPPVDRPIGYGLIIRATGWQASIWPVVIVQGMLASWMIRRTMQALFPAMGANWRPHLAVVVLLLLISSLPWCASQLMPDVFTSLVALGTFLLLFGRRMGILETGFLLLVVFFGTITHLSHPWMVLGALGAWAFIVRGGPLRKLRARLAAAVLLPVAGLAFIIGFNAAHGLGAVLSPTSDLFLAGKLIESGAMRIYLDRTCATDPVYLCTYKNELVNNAAHYVWSEQAPTRMGRDLVASSEQVRPVVHALLADPRMWGTLAWKSFMATASQLVHVDVGAGLSPYREESAPWWPIAGQYAHEVPHYLASRQQLGGWDLAPINRMGHLVLALSGLLIALAWPGRRCVRWHSFLVLMVAMVVANAAITGALANVYDRLQARITWVLVLAALLLVLQRLRPWCARWVRGR